MIFISFITFVLPDLHKYKIMDTPSLTKNKQTNKNFTSSRNAIHIKNGKLVLFFFFFNKRQLEFISVIQEAFWLTAPRSWRHFLIPRGSLSALPTPGLFDAVFQGLCAHFLKYMWCILVFVIYLGDT